MGKLQLTNNGYKFTKNIKSGNGCKWRCVNQVNRRYTCKATASTYYRLGIECATFHREHNHPPSVLH